MSMTDGCSNNSDSGALPWPLSLFTLINEKKTQIHMKLVACEFLMSWRESGCVDGVNRALVGGPGHVC